MLVVERRAKPSPGGGPVQGQCVEREPLARARRERGSVQPGPLGGDRKTHAAEAYTATILEVFG